MVDTVNHNVRTSVIDFTTARSAFVGNNATSAPPKLLEKNSEVEGGRKPINVTAFEYWEKGRQLWQSKWPGWQGFFQSRYSGWPIAFIFALYVYYLLVCVLLPTNVPIKVQVKANTSAVISKLKYVKSKMYSNRFQLFSVFIFAEPAHL